MQHSSHSRVEVVFTIILIILGPHLEPEHDLCGCAEVLDRRLQAGGAGHRRGGVVEAPAAWAHAQSSPAYRTSHAACPALPPRCNPPAAQSPPAPVSTPPAGGLPPATAAPPSLLPLLLLPCRRYPRPCPSFCVLHGAFRNQCPHLPLLQHRQSRPTVATPRRVLTKAAAQHGQRGLRGGQRHRDDAHPELHGGGGRGEEAGQEGVDAVCTSIVRSWAPSKCLGRRMHAPHRHRPPKPLADAPPIDPPEAPASSASQAEGGTSRSRRRRAAARARSRWGRGAAPARRSEGRPAGRGRGSRGGRVGTGRVLGSTARGQPGEEGPPRPLACACSRDATPPLPLALPLAACPRPPAPPACPRTLYPLATRATRQNKKCACQDQCRLSGCTVSTAAASITRWAPSSTSSPACPAAAPAVPAAARGGGAGRAAGRAAPAVLVDGGAGLGAGGCAWVPRLTSKSGSTSCARKSWNETMRNERSGGPRVSHQAAAQARHMATQRTSLKAGGRWFSAGAAAAATAAAASGSSSKRQRRRRERHKQQQAASAASSGSSGSKQQRQQQAAAAAASGSSSK